MLCRGELVEPLVIGADEPPVFLAGDVLFYLTGNLSRAWKTKVLNILRGQSIQGIAPYFSLWNGSPEAGGSELSGDNYARAALTFGAPAEQTSGQIIARNSVATAFNRPSTAWGTWTHSAIYSASSSGEPVYIKALVESVEIKKGYRRVRAARAPKGLSIEQRPEEINSRETFGHWEMDTVQGIQKSRPRLLVLTERLSRHEIMIPIKTNTTESVVKALNTLERKYGALFYKVFRSITVDNGPEFADCAGMEKACRRKGARTTVYYCHPYSSWERGSNERQNGMIRRKHPKGTDFATIPASTLKKTEEWINNYPRKIFNFHTAAEVFEACMNSL